MKSSILLFLLLIGLFFPGKSQTPSYYYVSVASPDKSINYVFGFYPNSSTYTEPSGQTPYTCIKAAVINDKTAKIFESKDFKVMILLKSGKLIRNYTTTVSSGEYMVNYTTQPGETHYQYYCFLGKVKMEDISRVWYILGDMQIFELTYVESK